MSFNPLTESPYVAGNVTITGAAAAVNLWSLIQSQLDSNCGGAPISLLLYADSTNTSPVLIGTAGVSAASYGFPLAASTSKAYVPGIPRGAVPMDRIFVFCAANATLHVELYI